MQWLNGFDGGNDESISLTVPTLFNMQAVYTPPPSGIAA
jgi:hypothetical protein